MDKEKITGLSGLIAGGIGSICCVGPVVLGSLGFGAGVIGNARQLGVLHLPFMALAFLLFGAAFYFHYRRKRAVGIAQGICRARFGTINRGSLFLWSLVLVTGVLYLFPYIF